MRPTKIDTIQLTQYLHLVSPDEPDPGYAEIWSSAGFGRVDMETFDNDFDMSTTAEAVLWRDEDNTSLQGRHWVTSPDSWSQWLADSDAPSLVSRSWRFIQFLLSKNYVYPPIHPPITWVEHNPVTWGGYRSETIVLTVKKHGQGWQWTVRGEHGSDVWNDSPTIEEAKQAAEAAIGA